MAATWSIDRYVVQREISRDSSYVFYRGTGKETGSVIIKIPRRNPPVEADIAALQDEYATLAALSVPGIVRPREFLRSSSTCCLVLEDDGGIPLNSMRLRPMDSFFNVSIQLCGVLSELHRVNMTHRGLNPQSIFVHPETEAVCVVDCSRVVRSLDDIREANPLQHYRETLAYISPEQTGRINRSTDYRTDFYSLGTIFHELLTGSPPFCSNDPLEIIHGHIAKEPSSLSSIDPSIPPPVSDIVLKLLAKRAEDRYQSASGIREDLEQCSRDWKRRKSIARFQLGRNDVSDRFMIPQRLYGRGEELAAIVAAFDGACGGAAAMMLVTGPAGVGKTALIEELYRPIAQRKGWFISGKFDQVARNVPFGAIIQALRGLVRQLLTETEERLSLWRARLLEALGNNSGVLAEVIPEISLILGPQQQPPGLEPAETQNRFRHVFQSFLEVLAQRQHPLVMFLDDLQWADPATLSLLQPLLTSRSVRYFFLICAHRDSGDTIPLSQVLKGLEQSGAVLYRVSLQPLGLEELVCLIQDTLHNERSEAAVLAQIVFAKTAGNPFFVRQFLKTLRQKGLISFDHDRSKWVFDAGDLRSAEISDNVIGLMTQKIQQLAPATQRALTLAACIGCRFDLNTLAVVCRNTPSGAVQEIKGAIEQGLIYQAQHSNETYSFLHDRVQQAAYALIPEEQRKLVHLTVGRLLRDTGSRSVFEEGLFDMVQHLNHGIDLVTEEAERLELAHLNLAAGRKAKSSTAYQAALAYFDAGLKLLDPNQWDSDHEFMMALQLEKAECEYLCGNFEKAERCFEVILENAATAIEKAQVYHLKMVQFENLSRYADAVASGIQALSLFDVFFPESTQARQETLEMEIRDIQKALKGRNVEDLADLHIMSDPQIRMVMKILTALWAPAYLTGDQALTQLVSATMVRLSLIYGNIEESAYGYVTHAITIGPGRGDYILAHKFGRLALMLNERLNDRRQRPKVHQQFNAHVNLWHQPLETCIPHAREACRSGLEAGDFTYASYGAYTESWIGFLTSRNFARFARDYSPNLELLRKLRMDSFADAQKLMLAWGRALQGTTVSRFSLSTEDFDEEAYCTSYADNPFFTAIFHIAKVHLFVTFGDYRGALEFEQKARSVIHAVGGTVWPVLLNYWSSLARTALYREATETDRTAYMQKVLMQRDALEILAANCPSNFRCQHLLLSAEIERISNRHFNAVESYEQALRFSRETGNLQSEALAHELYARFWIERGNDRIGGVFLHEAWRLYTELHANAKAQELQKTYFVPLASIDEPTEASNPSALDISTAIKSVHAIAGAIELDDLLRRLIKLSLENAGAQRGFFLRERDDELLIEAEGSIQNEVEVRQSKQIVPGLLSRAIVRYVRKTLESVILDDAIADERFAGDYYIAQTHPKSILCLPIVHQGKLGGVLYLENNLTTHAFSADRIEIMRILSAQASISLENAQLYEELKEEAARRKHAEERNRTLLEINNAIITTLTHKDLFHAICRALRTAIDFDRSGLLLHDAKNNALRILAVEGSFQSDRFKVGTIVDRHDSHAAWVFDHQRALLRKDLSSDRRFTPEHLLFAEGVRSLCTAPLIIRGQAIGTLSIMSSTPGKYTEEDLDFLQDVANQVALSVENMKSYEEISFLKARLEAENVYLQEEIRQQHNFEEIVGSSFPMLELLRQVERVAPTDSTVLIYGETGTGKELVARAIHNRSRRKDRPLVKVNCGAISAGLVESELFGHVKGAFTGAVANRVGRFELANGGTLFLDEVGELPAETQVKLLRVLQEREFEPVGSSRSVKVDVRIIAASNRDLEAAVAQGSFRSDLYYRLNVFPMKVAPLRERRSDIPLLVTFFLSRYSKQIGKQIDSVSHKTMDRLMAYSWPGNVRELENIVQRLIVLSSGPVLSLSEDSEVLDVPFKSSDRMLIAPSTGFEGHSPTSLEETDRRHILSVLDQTRWVIDGPKGAAALLNLHPNTLRSRLKKLGIQRPQNKKSAQGI